MVPHHHHQSEVDWLVGVTFVVVAAGVERLVD
jgi:hypothetical protein